MPRAVPRYNHTYVYCPREKERREAKDCYRCPFYIKRDFHYIYCLYEIRKLMGDGVSLVRHNPKVIVRDGDGAIYSVHYSHGELHITKINTPIQ